MVIRRCFPPYLAFISNEGISFLFFLQFFLYIKYNATHVVLIDTISLCLSTNLKQFKKLSERKKLFRTKYNVFYYFSMVFADGKWLQRDTFCNWFSTQNQKQKKKKGKKIKSVIRPRISALKIWIWQMFLLFIPLCCLWHLLLLKLFWCMFLKI